MDIRSDSIVALSSCAPDRIPPLFAGGSEMTERTRALDWTLTPVGPINLWPQSLRTALSICLESRYPMAILWGTARTQFYNDAYIPLLGSKHPRFLGRPAPECWSEIWPLIGPVFDGVYRRGQATWSEDLRLILRRHLPQEETYFTFSCSPVRDDEGAIAGTFCACSETTKRVIQERRLLTLGHLSRAAAEPHNATDACELAVRILADNPADIPFALIYLKDADGTHATLKAMCGLERDCVAAPKTIDLRDQPCSCGWPIAEVLATGEPRQVSGLERRLGHLPAGLWTESTREALIVPLAGPGQSRPTGLFISGLSPRRMLDADYRTFLGLVAGHVGSSITSAWAFEEERRRTARAQLLRAAAEKSEANMPIELCAELAAMKRLHELTARWLRSDQLQAVLQEVIDASIELLNADFGNIRLYDIASRGLKIVAQRGFDQDFPGFSETVYEGTGSCGTALQRRSRVVVEDVLAEPSFAPLMPVVISSGFRAAQSTPLISRSGELLGVLSTHFRRPYRPSAGDLRLLDLYARQAADLIERGQADEKLRRSEERFRSCFELGLIGAAFTSPDKGILEVNDELCRILGYAREELLSKSWAELTHSDDLAADVAQFERTLVGDIDGYSLDKRWIRKDGTLVYSIMAARAVRRADGTLDYLIGLVQDISARKSAEESLLRLQADLGHVSRMATMGELTSSIAHEIKQPLAAITANAQACARWLAQEPSNAQEATTAVARIVRDASRASKVVSRVRDFIQRKAMRISRLDLAAITSEALSMTESEIRAHGVSFSVVLAPKLAPAIGDRVQVQQVILNLITNAIEAMDSVSERKLTLAVTVNRSKRRELRVAVSDTGVGLNTDQRDHLFDAFYTSKPCGMGMGLAISRSIIEAHHGELWVTDNDGPGVTFQFTLPIERSA